MAWFLALEIGFLTELYFYLIIKCNADHQLNLGKKTHLFIWMISLGGGIGIALMLKRWGALGQVSCGVLASYLLTASITDLQTYEVYDFLPVVTALVGTGVVFMDFRGSSVLSLLIFVCLQCFIFMGMYGKADVYAFMVCAMFESRFGLGLMTYLMHMGAAFLLLGVIQGIRGNVSRRGNLKRSVAFLPYISLTVWWFL